MFDGPSESQAEKEDRPEHDEATGPDEGATAPVGPAGAGAFACPRASALPCLHGQGW